MRVFPFSSVMVSFLASLLWMRSDSICEHTVPVQKCPLQKSSWSIFAYVTGRTTAMMNATEAAVQRPSDC